MPGAVDAALGDGAAPAWALASPGASTVEAEGGWVLEATLGVAIRERSAAIAAETLSKPQLELSKVHAATDIVDLA
jgi:hypothetical protein